jgi:ankyrin repeat protein
MKDTLRLFRPLPAAGLALFFLLNALLAQDAAPSAPPKPLPALIQAAKQGYSFKTMVDFKRRLDQTAGDLNLMTDEMGHTALHYAVERHNDDMALLLLLRGLSPNTADNDGVTPLFWAVQCGQEPMTSLFILAGADINHLSAHDLTTPLTIAIEYGNYKMAEILLWLGANTTVPGLPKERQPLAVAQAAGRGDLVQLVNDYGVPDAVTFANQPRLVPGFIKEGLEDAARKGDFLQLEALLRSGADINSRDSHGATALHRAISAGQSQMVFYLLLLGANPSIQDNDGNTPLMRTMGWFGGGLDGMRRYLIYKGANLWLTRKDGQSELFWAVTRANEHGLQLLLWRGLDGRAANPKLGTPTQYAYDLGAQRLIDVLRRNGIDDPIKDHGDPVWRLHNAAKRGDLALIKNLLASGVPPDAPDANGRSAMMDAISTRNIPAARLLVANGASINYRNPKNGETPLMSTMCWDYGEMTQFREDLLDAGVDLNAKSDDGINAVMRGIWHHPTKPLMQLIAHGADLNARDPLGRTVLTRAIADGNLETADYLRQNGARE